jgi:hypothetical protein
MNNNDSAELFRIHWRSPPVALLVLWFGVAMGLTWPHLRVVIPLGLELLLALVLLFVLFTVEVDQEGLVLLRRSRLRWSQVVSVKLSSVLGMRHLVIVHRGGGRWWLPLYVRGQARLLRALAEKAPMGNPLRLYAESALDSNSRR